MSETEASRPSAAKRAISPPGRVIVVGSANEDIVVRSADLPAPGQTVVGRNLTRLPGGKSANQAVAAARAGGHVHFVGAVGDDEAGLRATASLRNENVDVSGLLTVPKEPTGTALVVVDDHGENQITIVPGANAMLGEDHVAASLRPLGLNPADVCLIGFEVGDPAVCAAAEHAAAAGSLLVVNPAPARPLPESLLDARPLLVPNASEITALTGIDDPGTAGRRLAARTGSPVVVTLGVQGALIIQGDSRHEVPSMAVTATDTTGAGDTFAGVMCASLADGSGLLQAVERAAIAAALSVTVAGARNGSPLGSEITTATAKLSASSRAT